MLNMPPPNLPVHEPGDPLYWDAADFNAAAAYAEMVANTSGRIDHDRSEWVQVGGDVGGGKYTNSTIMVPDPANPGQLTAGPVTGVTVYETKGKSGLAAPPAKILRAWPDPFGDWRGSYFGVGPPPCDYFVHVRDACTGVAVAGAALSMAKAGQATLTGTTDAGGNATLHPPAGAVGSWTLTVSKAGYTTQIVAAAVACNPLDQSLVSLAAPAYHATTFAVTGCYGLPLAGAAVTISGPAAGTFITDGSGVAHFGLIPAGSYTWTASKARFDPATGTFTVNSTCTGTSAGTVAAALTPAAGYHCWYVGCPDPLADTLTLTLPRGSLTLTYDASRSEWWGTLAKALPDCVRHWAGTSTCTGATTGAGTVNFVYQFASLNFSVINQGCTNAPFLTYSDGVGDPHVLQPNFQAGPNHNYTVAAFTCPPAFAASGTVLFPQTGGEYCATAAGAVDNGTFTLSE